MHCPKCGSIIDNNSASCKFCDNKILTSDRKKELGHGSLTVPAPESQQLGIQHKTITIDPNSWLSKGQLDALLNDGWEIVSSTPVGGNYDACNTCCLGAVFLPLALLGKKPNKISYVLKKDFSKHQNKK
jgi:hypothetical protein